MSSDELDNLVRAGLLKPEPGDQREFDGLLDSGRKRLADATKKDLSPDLGLKPEVWRVLDKCHASRNALEYDGMFYVDGQLLLDLLKTTETVEKALQTLGPIRQPK